MARCRNGSETTPFHTRQSSSSPTKWWTWCSSKQWCDIFGPSFISGPTLFCTFPRSLGVWVHLPCVNMCHLTSIGKLSLAFQQRLQRVSEPDGWNHPDSIISPVFVESKGLSTLIVLICLDMSWCWGLLPAPSPFPNVALVKSFTKNQPLQQYMAFGLTC